MSFLRQLKKLFSRGEKTKIAPVRDSKPETKTAFGAGSFKSSISNSSDASNQGVAGGITSAPDASGLSSNISSTALSSQSSSSSSKDKRLHGHLSSMDSGSVSSSASKYKVDKVSSRPTTAIESRQPPSTENTSSDSVIIGKINDDNQAIHLKDNADVNTASIPGQVLPGEGKKLSPVPEGEGDSKSPIDNNKVKSDLSTEQGTKHGRTIKTPQYFTFSPQDIQRSYQRESEKAAKAQADREAAEKAIQDALYKNSLRPRKKT